MAATASHPAQMRLALLLMLPYSSSRTTRY
jgi:hypothetical protein